MQAKYYLSVIVAFILWGLFSFPLKALSAYSSLDILLSRLIMASAIIVLISFIFLNKKSKEDIKRFKNFSKTQKKHLLLINIISSAMLAVNWYLFIYVMNNISVKATSLAYMICPIVTTFLAFIFLKERLTKIQWIAVLISFLSCILLSIGSLLDTFYSFLIALSYAIYLVLQKYNYQLSRFFTLTFQIVIGSFLLLPFFSYTQSVPIKGTYFYAIIFLIATLFTIVPMFLNVYSLNKLSSSTAGFFIYLNPVISFFLAFFYFKEVVSTVELLSYSLVFCAVVLFNYEVGKFYFNRKNRAV